MNDRIFTKYFEDLEFYAAGYKVTLDVLGIEEDSIDYRITEVQIIDEAVEGYPYKAELFFHYMTDLDDDVQEYLYNLPEDVKERFDGFLSELYCK